MNSGQTSYPNPMGSLRESGEGLEQVCNPPKSYTRVRGYTDCAAKPSGTSSCAEPWPRSSPIFL